MAKKKRFQLTYGITNGSLTSRGSTMIVEDTEAEARARMAQSLVYLQRWGYYLEWSSGKEIEVEVPESEAT